MSDQISLLEIRAQCDEGYASTYVYTSTLLALIDVAEAALKVASQISPWATGDMGALQRVLGRFTPDPVVVRTPDGTSGPTQIIRRYELPIPEETA